MSEATVALWIERCAQYQQISRCWASLAFQHSEVNKSVPGDAGGNTDSSSMRIAVIDHLWGGMIIG